MCQLLLLSWVTNLIIELYKSHSVNSCQSLSKCTFANNTKVRFLNELNIKLIITIFVLLQKTGKAVKILLQSFKTRTKNIILFK